VLIKKKKNPRGVGVDVAGSFGVYPASEKGPVSTQDGKLKKKV